MENPLNELCIRILGSLIEKQISTPDYYPLTLNALTNACNQKNNRDPVVQYDDTTVVRGIDELRERGLVAMVTGAGMRVPKYRQKFTDVYSFDDQQTAVMCVLMLRGPQTIGEIRSRGSMLFNFPSMNEVEVILTSFIQRTPEPLVVRLPVQPGQKEARFMHLLSGPPALKNSADVQLHEPARIQVQAENERLAALEESVKVLQEQVDQLRKQFTEFHKQFE